MFGLSMLDVAIGLVLIYLVASLLATATAEIIESIFKYRASDLARGITQLVQDPSLARDVYDHPLIRGLHEPTKRGARPPSYIPAAVFATVFLDLLLPKRAQTPSPNEDLEDRTATAGSVRVENRVPGERARKILESLQAVAGANLQAAVEGWYDAGMDRVSGWYKRRAQWITFFIGMTLAVALNIDTITIAQRLATDRTKREALVNAATLHLERNSTEGEPIQQIKTHLDVLDSYGLPIGWKKYSVVNTKQEAWTFLFQLVGWLLTGLAISLGAPFWFDLLNKFIVIRSTVKPKEKSPEEKSKA
jgi:hypothetical protein